MAAEGSAYASVFALEGVMFLVSAALAWKISVPLAAKAAGPDDEANRRRQSPLQVAHET